MAEPHAVIRKQSHRAQAAPGKTLALLASVLVALLAVAISPLATQQAAYAEGSLAVGNAPALQSSAGATDLNAAVAAAQERVSVAESELAAAQADQAAAQGAIDAETEDPGSNEGHKEWTVYGLFKNIRDTAEEGSAAYWDAQCALDILDGGENSTGHSYATHQGPAPDGQNASNWANIASNIAWAERGDAVALGNVLTSLEFLNEFNSIRDEENAAEGTTLSTTIGTNCRQMAISIVQCDTSKVNSVGHTQAYEGLENLSWSSAAGVPFSRSEYTDPYFGWYDEEKVNYKENNGGVTGHYTTLVDKNSDYFCEIAGFAVCSYQATLGECRELSTFGDFFQYDTNPTPEVQYSIEEFQQIANAYYNAQVEAGMLGTSAETRAANAAALQAANTRVANAKAELADAQTELAAAKNERDAFTNLATSSAVTISGVDDVTYDGAEHKPTPVVTVEVAGSGPVTLVANEDYTVNYPGSDYTNAGEAVVQIVGTGEEGSGAWWGSRNVSFTIERKSLDGAKDPITLSQTAYIYDGTAHEPAVTVKLAGKTLSGETDYTVSYADNTNAGTATATVTGKGNYTGTASKTFTIERVNVVAPSVVQGLVYNGEQQTGVAPNKYCAVEGGTATDAGTYTATVTLLDPQNNTWMLGDGSTATIEWTIASKKATVTSRDATKAYGEDDPAFTADVEGTIGSDALTYSFERESGESEGAYTITPKGEELQGNYRVTYVANGKLTITKAAPTIALADYGAIYTGQPVAYAGKVTKSGTTAEPAVAYFSDADCTSPVEPSQVKNAGTYYVRATLAADANHEEATSNVAQLVVKPKPVKVTVTGKSKTVAYIGERQSVSGYELACDDEDFDLASVEGPAQDAESVTTSGTDAGTHKAQAFAVGNFTNRDSNYDVTFEFGTPAMLTIEPREVTVKADDKAKMYGNPDPELTATVTGLLPGDEGLIRYSFNRVSGEDIRDGGYDIQVMGDSEQAGGNYRVTYVNGRLSITKRAVRIAIKGVSQTAVYDGREHAAAGFTVSIPSGENIAKEDIRLDPAHSASAKGINAGSYSMGLDATAFAVSESVARNYDVTFAVTDGKLTIAKAASSVSLAGNQTKTYNGKAQAYTGKVAKSGSTAKPALAYYADAKCTKAATPKAAGTYYVCATLAGDANHAAAASAPAKLTIAKAKNPLAFKAQKKQVKLAKLKKAKQTVAIAKATKAQGKVTYSISKVAKAKYKKNFSINKATGKITVKKGTPKGAYKLTVKAAAKGNANYKPGNMSKAITITVK